jgi:D-aminopeptidase
MKPFALLAIAALQLSAAAAQDAPRARDLGVPFDGTPGALNAITDVEGVTVGHETIIRDLRGGHAARTGVTAILPRGEGSFAEPVFAGFFSLNGNGEMTGTHWVEESGTLEGPVMITNTHSVGAVHQGVIKWRVEKAAADSTGYWWSLPVVAETWDGHLNDINGFHVTEKHAARALAAAKSGPVAEGNVGGGTGMICHEFKCGIGTSSRKVSVAGGDYTVGVLVQANYGLRSELRIAGVPVGKHLTEDLAYDDPPGDTGSIIIVVATDAPLLPHQLKRVARRAALGLARDGSYAGNGSGDIFIAFSTTEPKGEGETKEGSFLVNDVLDPVFLATVQATEEAIVNAMVAAGDMTGDMGHRAVAIDHDELRAVLKQYGRLAE